MINFTTVQCIGKIKKQLYGRRFFNNKKNHLSFCFQNKNFNSKPNLGCLDLQGKNPLSTQIMYGIKTNTFNSITLLIVLRFINRDLRV